MSSHSFPVQSDSSSPQWREIEDLLDEIAQAAKSPLSELDFYRLLLNRIAPAIGAAGGAVWTAARPGELRLECQNNLTTAPSTAAADVPACHQSLVEDALASGQPRVVPPPAAPAPGAAVNLTDCTLIAYPFPPGLRTPGVLEFTRRGQMSAAETHGYLRVMAALVELTGDFHRHRELAQLRGREHVWRQNERFALRVHRSLDVAQTAFLIANEARRLLACDRVGVLVRHGAKFRALAVSGVDVLDRRAELVRKLEAVANRAAAAGDPVWYCDPVADVPDEIERPLQAYLDESHARVMAIVPLVEGATDAGRPAHVVGVITVEQFQSSESDVDLRERTTAVAHHAALALTNALVHSRLPLASLGRMLARVRWLAEARQLPRTLLALAAVALVVAAAALIPADFDLEARGELQPERRRDVFASDDGVVSELLVDHGRAVRVGEPLVVLRKPQLDLEFSRVAGEMQTAEKKLAAVQAERLTNLPAAPEARRQVRQLTADEEELKKQLEGLREQREILERQRSELIVRSPLNGQALTWNLKELLETRPVQRGQTLLAVADLDGPWILELHLPDHRAGHVLAARHELDPNLDVSFALTSDPGMVYHGRIVDMALSSQLDETTGATVLVKVAFDRGEVAGLRPAATAIAQIHCGRRAIGYVWLHDLFEAVQSHWWW